MMTSETKTRTSTNTIKKSKLEVVQSDKMHLIDYDKAKRDILAELAYSSEFKQKLRSAIAKKHVQQLKHNFGDIFQEIFIELGKKDSEYLFKEYIKSPGRIIAIALTIGKSFFRINPKYPDYPNKSIVHKLNYGSVMTGGAEFISPTDVEYEFEDNPRQNGLALSDEGLEARHTEEQFDKEEASINLIESLRDDLTDREYTALGYLLNHFNKTKEHTVNYDNKAFKKIMTTHAELIIKIKGILAERGINNLDEVFTNKH